MEGIQFFGKVDRKGKHSRGNITSQYPAWYNSTSIEAMEDRINSEERRVESGQVPLDERPYVRADITKMKARHSQIMSSKPELRGGDIDKVAKHIDGLGKLISESMFTDSDMRRGTANAHIEADRMSKPCIRVNPEVAEACGVKVSAKGEVTRNGAIKMWQMGRKLLDENTNAEVLRRA